MDTTTPVSAAQSVFPVFPEPSGKEDWKRLLLILMLALVILTAGMAIGAGLAIIHFSQAISQADATPEQTARLVTAKIAAAAALTPQESLKTGELVEKRLAEIAELRERYEREVNEKLGGMRADVSCVIGPERTDMCGDWMRRYSRYAPAKEDGAAKKEACCCGEGDSHCNLK